MAMTLTSPPMLATPSVPRPVGCAGQMRPARYAFNVIPSLRLLKIEIGGFWTMATVQRFAAELDAYGARVRTPGPRFVILCNVTGSAIQSRDVLASFAQMMADGSDQIRRFALVTNDPRSRMQARRMLSARPDAAIFDTDVEALHWLRQR